MTGVRYYADAAAVLQEPERHSDNSAGLTPEALAADQKPCQIAPKTDATPPTKTPRQLPYRYYGPWQKKRWTEDEVEFESNLANDTTSRQRLLDQPKHLNDPQLFACLLDHRYRRYGIEGLSMFWEAVKTRGIDLPTRDYRESKGIGLPAEKLWMAFLTLGFQDKKVLEEVVTYADDILEKHRRRWLRLYVTIIQHLLVNDRGSEALSWHNRLFEKHPPTEIGFAEMCRLVVFKRGDLRALKEIYKRNVHRNAYAKIVPILCEQEDFKSALEWHFTLIRRGDLPAVAKHTEPLTNFLATFDRPNAVRVIQSLQEAGASFNLTSTVKDNVKISREMMNLIHGEAFNVPVKAYNDHLGARWLATKWISLDVAINAIHALGVQEIGPLSLQAICLREPEPLNITRRIEQLQGLGISIGSSKFSRAVKHFAQNRMYDYLHGLLNSDQHPDSLEDWKLQEALLASFARNRDWDQYHRTLAIRLMDSTVPDNEAENIWLRVQLTRGDIPAALDTLSKMHMNGHVVKTRTISYIVQKILRPRQSGRRPMPSTSGSSDLDMAINVLKGIINAGNAIPAACWRDIIRRLGMLGRQPDLHDLCIFLASAYGPSDRSNLGGRPSHRLRVPNQVPTSHPLHPLKILFPTSLQKAIVEWGFIHALKSRQANIPQSTELMPSNDSTMQVTSGISLLRQLYQYGVDIDAQGVRSAIFNRLIIYYGPGRSNKKYNVIARDLVPKLHIMVRQIDEAMGTQVFGNVDLKRLMMSHGLSRLRRRDGNQQRRLQGRGH